MSTHDAGIGCPVCGETYSDRRACGCAWRQEHYRRVRRLRAIDQRLAAARSPGERAALTEERREHVARMKAS